MVWNFAGSQKLPC
jgi:hypothetical protein